MRQYEAKLKAILEISELYDRIIMEIYNILSNLLIGEK